MLLQAGGRANALRALLKSEQERGPDFLRLANSLSALYPNSSDEKRLLDEYEQGVKHSQATNTLHHAVLCKEVHDFLYKGSIDPKQTVSGWGGWTSETPTPGG